MNLEHLIFGFNLITLMTSAMAFSMGWLLKNRLNNPTFNACLLCFTAINLQIFYVLSTFYVEINNIINPGIINALFFFTLIADALLIISLPLFMNALFVTHKKDWVNALFIGLAGAHALLKSINAMLFHSSLFHGYSDFIFLAPIFYCLYIFFKHKKNTQSFDPELRTVFQRGIRITLLFVPGFIADMGWSKLQYEWGVIPIGFYFIALYCLIMNILIMLHLKRYLSGTRLSLAEFQLFATTHKLTEREMDICSLIMNGYSNQGICEQLFIEKSTVKTHITNILSKTHCNSRFQLLQRILNLKGFHYESEK